MPDARDVLITGLGVVCPLGVGCDAYWNALESGKSGIDWMPELPNTDLPFRHAARIKDFDAKQYVQPRKTIKVMCGGIQSAYASAALAIQTGKLTRDSALAERFGVVLGSEVFFGELDEIRPAFRDGTPPHRSQIDDWSEAAFKELFPLWMLKYLPNMAACHISIAHDARGPNNTIVAGGVSSLLAVIEAANTIRRGHADVMLAGGSGELCSFGCVPFRGWNQLSKWEGDPPGACRPFEKRRSGIVLGEGAGVLLLETREHAERRGTTILGRVAGFAINFEPPAEPYKLRTGSSIRQSIRDALAHAGLTPHDVGHVNAHGEGSVNQDRIEAEAIRDTLGDVPVTALKSYFGDLGGGSGAVELIGSVLALMHGRVPPTLNYEEADPACPINVVRGEPQPVTKPTAIVLNQSTTGQAAAVVIAKD